MNKKSYSFNLDTFCNMLQMCPKLPGQKFVDPPFEEDILNFMRNLATLFNTNYSVMSKFNTSYASSSGTHEGTGVIPGVPDVPTYRSDDEEIPWKSSDEEDDDG
ncbi:hypothetical protein Tco_1183640 [Tanacetum coccineum]